ncbi:MAG: hypothetical protein IJV07_02590 [Alphaproteobacteria bacterium]|nr:hypothetical protein [Alphaproteobacteria bacterium]
MARIKYQRKPIETRLGHDGKHRLLRTSSAYEEKVEEMIKDQLVQNNTPEFIAKELEKFRDKPAFQYTDKEMSPALQEKMKNSFIAFTLYLQNLERKLRDRFARQETVRRLKEAGTKEEKRQILEEFHKEASIERKQTALKLDCMKEIREIRKSRLQLLADSSHPTASTEARESSSKSDERKRLDWRRARKAKKGSER